MTLTKDQGTSSAVEAREPGRGLLGNPLAIAGFAIAILLVLGWQLIAHPTWTAPTRDPAWYTWRANLILQSDPGSIAREWGPILGEAGGVFSGGYRVTVPLAGALLQRVAGIDLYSFSAFLMVGMPVLSGLALGAAGYRARKDPLIVYLSILAAAALFLTTPYVGYLDNITMLFILCATMAFIAPARTSWGARAALFLLGVAAAFTHPTTCVLFGLSLMAVFGWHVLTSRFRFGEALKRDAPMLWSVGVGMIVGLAAWVVGVWGPTASLADAALPPPYTKKFFLSRLGDWVLSMQPVITVPLILVAILGVVLTSRRRREPAEGYEIAALWWLFPLLGVFTFITGSSYQIAETGSPVVPYYRFMNATAAPIALVGLGSFFAIRWLHSPSGSRKTIAILIALVVGDAVWWKMTHPPSWMAALAAGVLVVLLAAAWRSFVLRPRAHALLAGALGSLVVLGALGWVLADGLQNRWVSENAQWINEPTRVALAAVNEVVSDSGVRPNVLIMNYNDGDDETRTNVAYGWAKSYTNFFRTGLPGDAAQYSATYMGTVENFLLGVPTDGRSTGYDVASEAYFEELQDRETEFEEPPVVFLYEGFYKGDVDVESALAQGTEIGPGVVVLEGDGLYAPPADVVQAATAAAEAERAALADHPGPLGNPLHQLRVLVGLFLLAILPGLIAAPFFELKDWPSKIALIPATSIVLSLLSGIAVLAMWRGPLTVSKGWAVVAVTLGVAGGLRLGRHAIVEKLASFGNFFNKMFSVFQVRDFAVLMGVQFLAQAGQGVVQGAIGKSIAFGGQKGFDVSNVPSADYLLKVVLALYVPYTLLSPFIGVFIDRFARRRVVWWANLVAAVIVAGLAVSVLLPLGDQTTEGKVGATAALVVALLAAQAVVRVVLAVKSAAIPDVLSGKDLLQGNGLSQAGGGLFQIVGIAFGTVVAGLLGAWIAVVGGAAVLVVAAFVAMRMQRVEAHPHQASFVKEASKVLRTIIAGLKEVAARPTAALGLFSFQMLRYQFWGFGLFVFALYAKSLVEGDSSDTLSLVLSGVGGLFGGALGMVLAQKWKDRIPPIRLLLASMALLGAGTLVLGGLVSVPGFAGMLFVGFFAFFLGKISVDTITQQAMPDDFRGRAFALFDIAYNLGFIVPALVLSFIWVEGDATRTRLILVASGAVFLGLTALVALWARAIRDQFAPKGDRSLHDVPTST
ncbi:MAG TPA: MFS transporter [Actinomycetota bacterium]|nr:MFS transporter [Actinomycetota bacterium]